jgi:hypothetical protein
LWRAASSSLAKAGLSGLAHVAWIPGTFVALVVGAAARLGKEAAAGLQPASGGAARAWQRSGGMVRSWQRSGRDEELRKYAVVADADIFPGVLGDDGGLSSELSLTGLDLSLGVFLLLKINFYVG